MFEMFEIVYTKSINVHMNSATEVLREYVHYVVIERHKSVRLEKITSSKLIRVYVVIALPSIMISQIATTHLTDQQISTPTTSTTPTTNHTLSKLGTKTLQQPH